MNRTRLSLCYLAAYLIVIGLGLLLAPGHTLHLLGSNAHYGEAMPRLAGMLMRGLGLNVAGMIRARTQALYRATLAVRAYFVLCLVGFWFLERDPFFLILLGIVLLGMALTLTSYLRDARAPGAPGTRGGTGLPV